MNKKFIFLLLFIFLFFQNCKTIEVQPKLEKPNDYSELIEETKRDIKANPSYYPDNNRTQKLLLSLDECNRASNKIYSEYEKTIEVIKQKDKLIESKVLLIQDLQKEIVSLNDSLETWNSIKYTFYAIVGVLIFAILWKYLSPILLPILKKLIGIPI